MLTGGGGLYLPVNAVGKYFRTDYRFAGKRKIISFGVYPDVSLARAREKRAEARKLLADGIDSSTACKETKHEQKWPENMGPMAHNGPAYRSKKFVKRCDT